MAIILHINNIYQVHYINVSKHITFCYVTDADILQYCHFIQTFIRILTHLSHTSVIIFIGIPDFTEYPPYYRTSAGGFAWWAPATARRPCSAAPAAGCWWRLQRRSPAAGLHSCCTEPLLWTLTTVWPSGKFGNLKIEELSKVRTAGQKICKIAELNFCLLSILWHIFCFGNRSDLTINTISE